MNYCYIHGYRDHGCITCNEQKRVNKETDAKSNASDMLALLVRIQKLECEVERLKERVK